MHALISLIQRDVKSIAHNMVALVSCVGLVVVPCLYAWINIAGSWDPYHNTSNITVAVATADKGYSSELMPISVNLGRELAAELCESSTINYELVSTTEAVEGVRSGHYYAALVIPENFSESLLGSLANPEAAANVTLYTNQKENPIASLVTSKAGTAAQASINRSFSEGLVRVGAGVMGQLQNYLTDDQVQSVATKLHEALSGAAQGLSQTATTTQNSAKLVEQAAGLMEGGTTATNGSLTATLDASGLLHQTSNDIATLASALSEAQKQIAAAQSQSNTQLEAVHDALESCFTDAENLSATSEDALTQAQQTVDTRASEVAAIQAHFNTNTQDLKAALNALEGLLSPTDPAYTFVHNANQQLSSFDQALSSAHDTLTQLSDELATSKNNLTEARSTAKDSKAKIQGLIQQARDALNQLSSTSNNELTQALPTLAQNIDGLATQSEQLNSSLTTTVNSLQAATDSANSQLKNLAGKMSTLASHTNTAADKLMSLDERLSSALNSKDVSQLRQILSSDADALANFVSKPVTLKRTAVFPVANNGSAMAPFYTTLALWIGALISCALIKVSPSEQTRKQLKLSYTQAYLGRLLLFVLIGLAQAALILLGDLYFLGIQCVHPVLFMVTGALASVVFVNIIFALTAAFGDVGKALAVVLMVLQVAGSGGTFPKQMLPGIFQTLYPWLPFVHAEGAFRAAIAGMWQGDAARELALLAAFLVPALIGGLALRRPLARVNLWFEEKLEQTHLM